jgi:potassium efflux system protein
MMLSRKYLYLFSLLSMLSFTALTYSQETKTPKKETRGKLFSDTTATDSDYLMAIEKAGEVMESAYNDADFDGASFRLFGEIKRTQSKLDLILNSLKGANPNVRNQQMYKTVLLEVKQELEDQNTAINLRNLNLEKIKTRVIDLRKDKTLMALLKDTIKRKQFKKEFGSLRKRYLSTDSLMTKNQGILNTKKRLTVQRKIAVSSAMVAVESTLEKSGISILKKEYPSLWSINDSVTSKKIQNIKGKIAIEESVAAYYLSYRAKGLLVLVFFMGLLFWYVSRNIKYLKTHGHDKNLSHFNFKYLNRGVTLPIVVIGLTIAIVSNLYAPALFIELLQLILLGVLTILFKNQWSKSAMRDWLYLVTLFSILCFLDLFIEVGFLQRIAFIVINVLGIRYGFVQIKSLKNQLYIKGFFKWASIIFIGLNALSILDNLFGRVSLSNMLSLTAFISLTQIVALSVLLKIILEIILLQIYTTRIKRGIEKIFDHESLSDNLKRPFIIVISYMWLVIIASNLNIWESLRTSFGSLLTHKNTIGSITFTLENIVLFFIIVWIAHLLQKYVAYFFGEIDDDENEENVNKRQHSKLLVTRLVVLIGGYLLAVAASGMPLDKLSILLGALGVGVGLGLQSVVNNFVSGVILIFDKPIQIGDVIEISSESGRVKSMGLRTTKINAPNGAEIIIPNGNLLSQNITNWTYTDNFKLVEIAIEVAGDITPDEINTIVIDALAEMPLVNNSKTPQIYYSAISDGKFKLQIKFWCSIYRTEESISSARQVLFSTFKAKGLGFTS